MADRALRLGDARSAIERYAQSEDATSSSQGAAPVQRREKARLGRIKALRLAGRISESEELAGKTAAELGKVMSDEARAELVWEAYCRAVRAGEEPHPMCASVRRGKSHFGASYPASFQAA